MGIVVVMDEGLNKQRHEARGEEHSHCVLECKRKFLVSLIVVVLHMGEMMQDCPHHELVEDNDPDKRYPGDCSGSYQVFVSWGRALRLLVLLTQKAGFPLWDEVEDYQDHKQEKDAEEPPFDDLQLLARGVLEVVPDYFLRARRLLYLYFLCFFSIDIVSKPLSKKEQILFLHEGSPVVFVVESNYDIFWLYCVLINLLESFSRLLPNNRLIVFELQIFLHGLFLHAGSVVMEVLRKDVFAGGEPLLELFVFGKNDDFVVADGFVFVSSYAVQNKVKDIPFILELQR